MINKKRGNKAQVTIFVIIALMIVVSIALIFSLSKSSVAPKISARDDPAGFIRTCSQESARSAEAVLLEHTGFINPSQSSASFMSFDGNKIAWMCYTPGFEETCTNRHPMLRAEIEKEILRYIKPEIEKCFADLKTQLSRYDYSDESALLLGVNILPNSIIVNITKSISYVKDEQKMSFKNFDSQINSPLFDFIVLTLEVVNDEVNCECGEESCNPELIRINSNNWDFVVSKPYYGSNGVEVYMIQEVSSGKTFKFAVRNCVEEAQF